MYPNSGSPYFLIGSPRVKSASVRLTQLFGDSDNGDDDDGDDGTSSSSSPTLEIKTVNNSLANVFVATLTVNGVAHDPSSGAFLHRSVIERGAVLEFTMTSDPSEGVGICN